MAGPLSPSLAHSDATDRWYFVTRWHDVGVAATKVDVTEQIEEIKRDAIRAFVAQVEQAWEAVDDREFGAPRYVLAQVMREQLAALEGAQQ